MDVELRNIPEGLEPVEFDKKFNITVVAPTTLIANIVANHITLYVDLTGAEVGDNTLPILYEAPEEYRVKTVVISQETLTITLK